MPFEKVYALLGEQNALYRPILDRQGCPVIPGAEPRDDALMAAFRRLPLAGRRVTDLGCNAGHFAFLAARLGASHVTGWDGDRRMIGVCRLLQAYYGLKAMEFLAADLNDPGIGLGQADVALLMDMIGLECVRRGRIDSRLDWLRRAAPQEAVISLRAVLPIDGDHLENRLAGAYAAYMTEGGLRLADYVHDRLDGQWTLVTRDVASRDGRRVLLRFRQQGAWAESEPRRQAVPSA